MLLRPLASRLRHTETLELTVQDHLEVRGTDLGTDSAGPDMGCHTCRVTVESPTESTHRSRSTFRTIWSGDQRHLRQKMKTPQRFQALLSESKAFLLAPVRIPCCQSTAVTWRASDFDSERGPFFASSGPNEMTLAVVCKAFHKKDLRSLGENLPRRALNTFFFFRVFGPKSSNSEPFPEV